jgi:tRNA pseudouridine55 synthase
VTDPNNPPKPTPTGLLIIDKPEGLTSMAVCRKVRWLLVQGGAHKKVKVGHGGTLDPLATGVVVVLIGKATRLCDTVMAGEKRYTAEIDLAYVSTTDDREGVISPAPMPAGGAPTLEQARAVCAAHTGTIQQRPPIYSAIWVDGERSYNLARRAVRQQTEAPADLPARPVDIHEITIVDYSFPRLTLDIRCGKGTYIRSLARDLGAALHTGGMLHTLRRTAVGRFTIEQAIPLASLPARLTQSDLLPATP